MRAMIYFFLAALVVGFAASSLAQEADAVFIKNLNRALDRFASDSNFKVQYDDVERARDPMIGEYFSLVNVKLTISSGGPSYVLIAKRVSLYKEDDVTYRLYLPASVEMDMALGDQIEKYTIRITGAPKVTLRHAPFSDMFSINSSANSMFKPTIKKKVRSQNKTAEYEGVIAITAESLTTNGWQALRPISPTLLPIYIEKLCTALNSKIQPQYMDYTFKGCVWSKR